MGEHTLKLSAIIGLALGWLSIWSAGSLSTLMTVVAGALAGSAVAAIGMRLIYNRLRAEHRSTEQGPAPTDPTKVPLPALSAVLVGMVIGVTIGQVMKDHYVLGHTSSAATFADWKETGYSKCQISRAMFAKSYSTPDSVHPCTDTALLRRNP
jgi:hypothetical protein